LAASMNQDNPAVVDRFRGKDASEGKNASA
jgi:hypothetical protein